MRSLNEIIAMNKAQHPRQATSLYHPETYAEIDSIGIDAIPAVNRIPAGYYMVDSMPLHDGKLDTMHRSWMAWLWTRRVVSFGVVFRELVAFERIDRADAEVAA